MVQTIPVAHTITVEIKYYDDPRIPEDQRYVAWIKEPEYAGCVEAAGSIADCMKEIAHSLRVLELYRKNIQK